MQGSGIILDGDLNDRALIQLFLRQNFIKKYFNDRKLGFGPPLNQFNLIFQHLFLDNNLILLEILELVDKAVIFVVDSRISIDKAR